MAAEKVGALFRQHDRARLAALGPVHSDRTASVRNEVLHLQPGQFAISATGLERRPQQRTKVGCCRIEQPLDFIQ